MEVCQAILPCGGTQIRYPGAMFIGIVGDTHDNLPRLREAAAIFRDRGARIVLHAGDFVSPFTATPFEEAGLRVVGVFGNNDGDKLFLTERFSKVGELYHGPHVFSLHGRSIVLMHEPYALDALIDSAHFDLVVFGHLHTCQLRQGPPLVVNPGECSGWLSGSATCAIVDLDSLSAELIKLHGSSPR